MGSFKSNPIQNPLTSAGRKIAFKQIAFSVVIVLICCLVMYINIGKEAALSALAGGCIAIIPNIVFALKAFQYAGASASKKVIDSFFSGVKIKMGITALLFSLAFKFLIILPLPFFGIFCVVMALPLITPFFVNSNFKL
jgi:ATP synthase protein I